MSELRELYQEVILDHNRKPRNFRKLEGPSRNAEGHNPLCGDKVTVYIAVDGDVVKDVAFEGVGCAISTASASLMTEIVKGKPVAEAMSLFDGFHEMVTSDPHNMPDTARLGKLAAFAGVCEFPLRVKCATLAWHTLKAAIVDEKRPISTE
ncbi:MAG: Fe-S cluster assembly sulfur transfer protein SufU [bacterium]